MRILATFAGAFSAGIFLAQYLKSENLLLYFFYCATALFLLSGLFVWKRKINIFHGGKRLILIAAGLSVAFSYNALYTRYVSASIENWVDTDQKINMTVCDYAIPTSYGARVSVKMKNFPFKIAYYGKEELLKAVPGQIVTDTVHFQNAGRIREDDITTFTSRGVFLLAYSRSHPVIMDGNILSPRWFPIRFGQAVKEQIQLFLSDDSAAFLIAILTGDKSNLSVQAAADISEAGLSHILAVSGMHCGFFLTFIIFLIGRHRRRMIAILSIPLLIFYVLLTGAHPSVIRACIMLSLFLTAPLLHRNSDSFTALFSALLLILLHNPFSIASVSLQLSFSSVFGIFCFSPKLYHCFIGNGGKIRSILIASFSASLGALVFTVPISAYYFGSFSFISPISNFLCLWAGSLIFSFGLMLILFSFIFSPLAILPAYILKLLIGYFLFTSHILAKIPFHALYFANPYLKYWLLLTYLFFIAAYFFKKFSNKKYIFSTSLTVFTLALATWLWQSEYTAIIDAVVLDVGQGQSILLKSEKNFVLVDCGSNNNWYNAGTIASQQLKSMGCNHLDAFILTHYDADHVNGIAEIIARMNVETIIAPTAENEEQKKISSLAQSYHIPIYILDEKIELDFGRGNLTIFPPVGTSKDENERGLSILATAGETDFLITGDMGQSTEKRLISLYQLPDIEYFVVGHHGSKYSTSEELLTAVKPEIACVSVGSNTYGHPTPEALGRLASYGCTVYRTDLEGNVHFALNP